MTDTVHVLLPLSLLEAIRSVDRPEGDEVEYVHELRNKRLGLSDTVYAQIRRYDEAMRRSQPIAATEAVSLARLIDRRPDAEAIFQSAGRIIAQRMYERIPRPTRRLAHVLPGFLARPIAFRRMRKAFSTFLHATLRKSGGDLLLQARANTMATAAGASESCAFYAETLRELLRLTIGVDSPVEQVQCVRNGATRCEWRCEWRRQTTSGDKHAGS